MGKLEKNNLDDRTRARNDSLWIALDWGGLMTPLAAQQVALDSLARPGIESFMAITEENWGIKEFQRDRTYQVEQFAVNQDRQIADDKAGTGRAKLAIQRAMDEYTLAVKIYDAKVRALLMGAKEYVAQVELEQLAVALSGAVLAVAKEGLHQKQVNASIYYEYIQRAMVEADIAKSQVEVAKAHVRAVMADIAAGEADIKVITAQIEQYVAQAQKADIQADVAMTFAEILTKKLSAVKLDVGQKEIAAGFGYIQSRLDDALTHLATQKIEETLKTDFANTALTEAGLIFPDEKASEGLHEQEQLNAREVFDYTRATTYQNIQDETELRALSVTAKEALSDQRLAVREGEDIKKTWAQALVNTAQKYVHKNRVMKTGRYEHITRHFEEIKTIKKGS
jgi:hypothetical protein